MRAQRSSSPAGGSGKADLAPQLSNVPKFCLGHQFSNGMKQAGVGVFGGDGDAWEMITEMREMRRGATDPQPPPAPPHTFFFPLSRLNSQFIN